MAQIRHSFAGQFPDGATWVVSRVRLQSTSDRQYRRHRRPGRDDPVRNDEPSSPHAAFASWSSGALGPRSHLPPDAFIGMGTDDAGLNQWCEHLVRLGRACAQCHKDLRAHRRTGTSHSSDGAIPIRRATATGQSGRPSPTTESRVAYSLSSLSRRSLEAENGLKRARKRPERSGRGP